MKPILALDVDGPIVVHGYPDGFELQVGEIPLTVPRQVPARLITLAEHFSILWSTSWERDASRILAPQLGLPAGLPFIAFGRYPRAAPGESRKLPALKAWLKAMPAAIVDDEIGHDMVAWARQRTVPTLLVEVDPRRGVLDEHVRALVSFANGLEQAPPHTTG